MKAVSPVRPQSRKSSVPAGVCGELALHCLSEHSLGVARYKMEEEDSLCLQYDMNDCYSRLKRLVPTIPPNKKVSKVEILQHVIDYILDLQLALDTHPVLLRQQPPARTPLTDLNADPAASVVNKQGDSILCR
ncbi:DNA-binding protein inhibitor ID-4 [Bombina bombina]|uniref:DNA-binding protein inhibitor ID-4 n=1 Tax=Bombina bombina TaxID=8345 RepID=UPI00235AF49B|nr:DNA-binding protein inhibitor ID-4 [Bombina bombina]